MKTDDLISFLAHDEGVLSSRMIVRSILCALCVGLLISLIFLFISFGVRVDIKDAMLLPVFWGKFIFFGLCALGAYFVTMQLARPGARLSSVFLGLLIALLFAWLFVMVSLVDISAVQRVDVLFSGSWRVCTLSIAALSLPIFVAAMWGLKQFAPTHPALCGAVAGLCAGAASVVIYSLHCPEMNIFFIGVWYVLGMCIPAVIGACLGRYLLRW